MPESRSAPGDVRTLVLADTARIPVWRTLRTLEFWKPRPLHTIARSLLLVVVSVLVVIAIGFMAATGRVAREDLLALVFYAALATFAWRPTTAAFMVMMTCSLGAIFMGSGGDLLELALALGLVAATCSPWVIAVYSVLLAVLTVGMVLNGSTLTDGGLYGIAGIAAITLLAGVGFRLVTARETLLLAERARVVNDLEVLAREAQERIADELHDGIAHDLTLVLFHARALPRQPDETARQVSLSTIEDSAEKALQSIQALLTLMRDATPPDMEDTCPTRYEGDVVEAVTSLGVLLKEAGIPSSVSVPQPALGIDAVAERALTETAIEAVTNILKHAPNSETASLEIVDRPGVVELVVENVTAGPLVEKSGRPSGRGLHRARQRLTQCGGELTSDRTSAGWLLRATVPMNTAQSR